MRRHALTLLAWLQALSLAAGVVLALAQSGEGSRGRAWALVGLNVVALACWAVLTWRVQRFHGWIKRFIRLLMAGHYEVGLPTSRGGDEVAGLERRLNDFADQLRVYDDLRARRVACSHRALWLVVRSVSDPVLVVDMDKRKVSLNPAAQRLFGVEEDTFALEALSALEANAAFFGLLRQATEADRAPVNGRVPLRLPAHDTEHECSVHIVPIKSTDEAIQSVAVLLS
jgi:PAS domain-containing protein